MKKYFERIVAIVVIAAVCTSSVFAQHRHHRGWDDFDHSLHTVQNVAGTAILLAGIAQLDSYTGLRFGYNAASLRLGGTFADDFETEPIGGANVGVVFGWNLGRSPLTLEPGIYYSFKGGKITADQWGGDYATGKYKMHMLEIPLVLKYNIVPTSGITLQPFAGTFMAFGLGGTTKFKGTNESFDTFSEDGFKSFDAGLRFGCGMAVDHFYVELAYDLGLVNLPHDTFADYDFDNWDDKIKSNCFSATIGVNF